MRSNSNWNTPDLPQRLAAHFERHANRSLTRGYAPSMCYGRHQGPPRPDARRAAVMMLIYRDKNEWTLPLTLRQGHLSAHPNQISLPGGSVDSGETSLAAAIREVAEELGYCCPADAVLGRLAPVFVFNSNFLVEPWVGWSANAPQFEPNESEVAKLIQIPLSAITDKSYFDTYSIERGDLSFQAPSIRWQQHEIWGATRIMLADLAQCLNDISSRDVDSPDVAPFHRP